MNIDDLQFGDFVSYHNEIVRVLYPDGDSTVSVQRTRFLDDSTYPLVLVSGLQELSPLQMADVPAIKAKLDVFRPELRISSNPYDDVNRFRRPTDAPAPGADVKIAVKERPQEPVEDTGRLGSACRACYFVTQEAHLWPCNRCSNRSMLLPKPEYLVQTPLVKL